MKNVTVYVFRNERCMECGFTLLSARFETLQAANEYAKAFRFSSVVEW